MPLNITPLPIDESGNGARIERLAFDRADAAMLAYAMGIASTTAYMCDNPVAANRLAHYRAVFQSMVPPVFRHLRWEEDVCEMVVAMCAAPEWSIRQETKTYLRDGRNVTVSVGDRTWTTGDRLSDAQFEDLATALEELAPMNCVRVESQNGERP